MPSDRPRRPQAGAHEVPAQGRPVPAPAFVVIERGRHPDGRVSRGRWVIVVETLRGTVTETIRAWQALRTPAQQASVFWRAIPVTLDPGHRTKHVVRRQPPGARHG